MVNFSEKEIAVKIRMYCARLFLLLSLAVALNGCNLDAQIQDLPSDIPTLSEKNTAIEVTPSSSQGVYSSGGYEAQVSVSYSYSSPEVQTSQGYTVQTNLQSTLFKK